MVQALLAKGAEVNAKNNNGVTALMAASLSGHLEVLQALLAKGADVNAKANNGATALDAATAGGHPEVRALLQAVLDKAAEKEERLNTPKARGRYSEFRRTIQGWDAYHALPSCLILWNML